MPTNLKKGSIYAMTLRYVMNDMKPEPPSMILNGILNEKSLLMITGQPKARKSFLAFNLALALARGKDFANFKVNKSYKVLILSAEGGYYPNRNRIQRMAKGLDDFAINNCAICFDVRINIDDDEDYELLRSEIEKNSPDVVVIDPLIRFHNADENSANEMMKVLGRIREIIEDYDCSIILVHHHGKDSRSGARGSSAITGEYDSEITIHSAKKNEPHKLQFNLRHAESPDDIRLIFNPVTYWFELYDNDNFLKILSDAGKLSKSDWVNESEQQGILKKTAAYSKIKNYEENGVIRKDKDDMYSMVV